MAVLYRITYTSIIVRSDTIDYSALPEYKISKPVTPFGSFKLAVLIFLAISLIIIIAGLISTDSNRDIIMPLISASLVLIFVIIVFRTFLSIISRLAAEKKAMEKFATDNNWIFDNKRQMASSEFNSLFDGNLPVKKGVFQRYLLRVDTTKAKFIIAGLTVIDSPTFIGRLLSKSAGKFPQPITVVKTTANISSDPQKYSVVSREDAKYIIILKPITAELLQNILS